MKLRNLPRFRPVSILLMVGALAAIATAAGAAPFRFPATPSGPSVVRDERDVAPFLAPWKAEGLHRARALATSVSPNQAAWDARFYDLDLDIAPATRSLNGTVRVKATVVAGPLTTLELDLVAALTVDAATAAGAPAVFSRSGDRVTVTLDRPYASGDWMDVTVTYHGDPTTGGSFGFNSVENGTLVWSLSEPYGARTWWPCKDAPEDKADSVTMRVAVPSGLITASNGLRTLATDDGVVARTVWKERYPIATYLVSVASFPYVVTQDWYRPAPGDSMPIQFYTFPSFVNQVAPLHAKIKTMMGAFASRFGEYPFIAEKYGHAQFLFGGGMEHQTCTSLGAYSEWVMAHELAHQWWGDMVTCRDFHHIWLNEGLATLSEALWAEAVGGAAAYHEDLSFNQYFGAGSVYVPDATDESRIFDYNLTYNKASWVFHMLRHVLGDATFFAALATYRAQFEYGAATTEQFRDVCEAVSGRDLDAFFQQWVYGEYYPQYRATWTAAPAGGGWDVTVTLQQIQNWQIFQMPVDLRVVTAAGNRDFRVENTTASQVYVLHVDAQPTGVRVDPDRWILRTVDEPVTNPVFDRAVLLVNGVDWSVYGTDLRSAYGDRAFWGLYPADFWDHFAPPAAGYPSPLPAPIGHGAVPADIMGRYRVVIWVGDDTNGDLTSWQNSPILSYLRAGGNVLLMTRAGTTFLGDSLRAYLGVQNPGIGTLTAVTATRPGLVDLTALKSQTLSAAYDTVRTRADSELLFRGTVTGVPNRGVGFVRVPAQGGTHRPFGGRFAFLAGRPYYWNHSVLRENVVTLLHDWFHEAAPGYAGVPENPAARIQLGDPRPNPARGPVTMRLTLPAAGRAGLEVLDLGGRRVRALPAQRYEPGTVELTWDGRDDDGRAAPAGVYWLRVSGELGEASRRVVVLRR
jgi:hypothetical protein